MYVVDYIGELRMLGRGALLSVKIASLFSHSFDGIIGETGCMSRSVELQLDLEHMMYAKFRIMCKALFFRFRLIRFN